MDNPSSLCGVVKKIKKERLMALSSRKQDKQLLLKILQKCTWVPLLPPTKASLISVQCTDMIQKKNVGQW